jgi:TatD DNase family protein
MRLIDTHAHLYLKQFEEDRTEVLQRAFDKGIDRIYLPNIDSSSIDDMLDLEKKYPQNCFAMMGLHPCSVKADFEEELGIVESWLEKRAFAAVGEIGIDLYWDKTYVEQQKEAFLRQIEWAKKIGLPIVIHSREATDVIIDLLKEVYDEQLRGIFHCFTGTVEQARAITDMGFLLGIGGVLTFKNAGLDKTIQEVDLQHLVLETDAPYLTPAPYRGKRNESSYVMYVAEKLADIKGEKLEKIADITTQNALRVFAAKTA